jgi:hypothetical protein
MSPVALLRLSWPPQALWPNRSRGKAWQARAAADAAYAQEADIAAYGQLGTLRQIANPRLEVTFHKTDAGRFDLDNAYSALKPAIDAIFGRWGRDDSLLRDVRLIKGEPVKGGCVLLEFSEADAWQHIADAARGMVTGSIK